MSACPVVATAANDFHSSSVRVPLVQSAEMDENGDGLADRLDLTLQTPVVPGENIYSATLLLFLEYRVRFHSPRRLAPQLPLPPAC